MPRDCPSEALPPTLRSDPVDFPTLSTPLSAPISREPAEDATDREVAAATVVAIIDDATVDAAVGNVECAASNVFAETCKPEDVAALKQTPVSRNVGGDGVKAP
jgi:hypothetical protein